MKYSLALFALAAYGSAQSTCPDGSSPGSANGTPVCCKGSLFLQNNNGDATTACIIGCKSTISMSTPSCFPQCTDGEGLSAITKVSGTCTTVPITASDYTSLVYGSAVQTGVVSTGPASTATAALTTAESSSTTAQNSASTGTSLAGTTTSSATPSSSTSKAMSPMITKGPVLALAGFAAGFAVL